MKTKRIPFDLEKAKAGAKIVTKNGLNVTIRAYLDDKSYNYPIEAIVKNPTGTSKDTLYYSKEGRLLSSGECDLDLLIEEEEPDYNPYKETVKSIADMVERYSELQSLEDLQDFYDNVKVKCREAIEYDKKWCKKQDEQKTKIESKFKVGDWIVQDTIGVYKVTEICESWYEVIDSYELHYSIGFDQESMCHLWEFNDAKDGDVLCYEARNEYRIFIYKHGHVYFHCHYYNGHLTTVDSYFVVPKHLLCYIHPATKEQRDILFQKMKESGYEWNPDTKELKKIDVDMAEKKIKTRKMTYKELSWWLREHPEEHRECTHEDISKSSSNVYSCYDYNTSYADEEVNEYIRIRKNGAEWMKPLIEI